MTNTNKMEISAWGKYESPTDFHCLEHHCADVAACFEVLVKDPVLRSRLTRAANLETLDAITEARLAVIAFFHDFAKLNSGFQFKVRDIHGPPPKAGHINEAYYCENQPDIIDALGLSEMFNDWGESVEPLLIASLSHHGRPPSRPNVTGTGPKRLWQPYQGYNPLNAAKRLNHCCRTWFPKAFEPGEYLPNSPALAHFLAGLIAIADQIGSAKEDFPFHSTPNDMYIEIAREQAIDAVSKRGFCRENRLRHARSISFLEIFDYQSLRPIQEYLADVSNEYPLLILESDTGSGKTEAALIRFISLWRAGSVDGLYFAVPTRAAAKQLHNRINRALKRLIPTEHWAEAVLAIPGYIKSGEVKGSPIEDYKVFWEDNPDEELRLARWSAESARKFLSATIAVGTVDQALLGALKVKWAHFRSTSLARSLLVVDEVHASDPYMTELLRQLLHDHLELGGYAMLMSATLGANAKSILCTKERRTDCPDIEISKSLPYPAISLVKDWNLETHKVKGRDYCKKISMRNEPWLNDVQQIAELVLSIANKGAKVLVIRNTVATAQALFKVIADKDNTDLLFDVNGVPTLHHSRFAVEDRHQLDNAVEKLLGKNRDGSGKIVIGTQTLEQSLDIDADYLVSDICPVDVLLQRLGRLHRHQGNSRPRSFGKPQCITLIPDEGLEIGLNGQLLKNGLGISKTGSGIYRNLLSVELTQELINQNSVWTIPEMNRSLVEWATHPERLAERAKELSGAWLELEQKSFGIIAAEVQRAKFHVLDRSTPFDDHHLKFHEDENIRTRLGDDGPRLRIENPVNGPFGNKIQTFNLPRHLFSDSDILEIGKGNISNENIEILDDKVIIRTGKAYFQYDNLGFRKC